MTHFENGAQLLWTSNTDRTRQVRAITWLKTMGRQLVRVTRGNQTGLCVALPVARLKRRFEEESDDE